MITSLIELSNANRFYDLEGRKEGVTIKGDFEGSVTGFWVRLGPMGEGIVSYNNKNYITSPLGFVSIPEGTQVELSYANGIYYSTF